MKKIINIPNFQKFVDILEEKKSLHNLCTNIIAPNICYLNNDGSHFNTVKQFISCQDNLEDKNICDILNFSENADDEEFVELRNEYLTLLSVAVLNIQNLKNKNICFSFIIFSKSFYFINIDITINLDKNIVKMGLLMSGSISLFETEEYPFTEESYNELINIIDKEASFDIISVLSDMEINLIDKESEDNINE